MTISDEVNKLFQVQQIKVYIDSVQTDSPLRATVDLGYDAVTASATILYDEVPDDLDFRQTVSIEMGYNGITQAVFTGFVVDDGRQFFPFDNEVKCLGNLHYAQYPYPAEVTYSGQTDTAIITDLLTKVGIGTVDLQGDSSVTYGNVQDAVLKRGSEPWDLINEIDQISGYATFDTPSAVQRRRVAGAPDSGDSVWAYVQGTNILSISRPRTSQQIHNKVIVTGLQTAGAATILAAWQAASSYIPSPPTYVTYNFRSQLIETTTHASSVAARLLQEQNRILDTIELEIPGNPTLLPGQVITVEAAKVGLNSATAFWIRHINHTFGPDGFTTKLTVEGGALGPTGSDVTDQEPVEDTGTVTDPGTTDPSASAGRPYATYTIAASDSVATGAPNCDAVCDGTADDVDINGLISTLDRGRSLLMEGSYAFNDTVYVPDYNELRGMGVFGSVITIGTWAANDDMIVDLGSYSTLADMYLLGFTGVSQIVAVGGEDQITIRNLIIEGGDMSEYGIHLQNARNVLIENVHVANCTVAGIYLDRCSGVTIQNCYVYGNNVGVRIEDGTGPSTRVRMINVEAWDSTSHGFLIGA